MHNHASAHARWTITPRCCAPRAGRNVYTREVERVLEQRPRVREVAVIRVLGKVSKHDLATTVAEQTPESGTPRAGR